MRRRWREMIRRLDAEHQVWLDSLPTHERDQVETALRDGWRGVFRYRRSARRRGVL